MTQATGTLLALVVPAVLSLRLNPACDFAKTLLQNRRPRTHARPPPEPWAPRYLCLPLISHFISLNHTTATFR